MAGAINEAYEPYGPEWAKEMSKFPKANLIEMFKNSQLKLAETKELLMETTRNLAHPAYGLSFSTTEAINNLREKAFDFLGVPKEGGEKKE